MNNAVVTVILPRVSDESRFPGFCAAVLSQSLPAELVICGGFDVNVLSGLDPDALKRIKAVSGEGAGAFAKALKAAEGEYIVISDVGFTYSPDAFAVMAHAAGEGGSACNVGLTSSDGARLFRDGFALEELADHPVFANHMLSRAVLSGNSLCPCGTTPFAILCFLADFYRYADFSAAGETLAYTGGVADEKLLAEEWALAVEYASVFSQTGDDSVSMMLLSNVMRTYLSSPCEDMFDTLKAVTACFSDDYAVLSWLGIKYGVDAVKLTDVKTAFSDFRSDGCIRYREVKQPLLPDAVIRGFFSGKLGISVLKKCIGAWGYYKFYRMRDGFIKKTGCRVCRRLLGGEFDA